MNTVDSWKYYNGRSLVYLCNRHASHMDLACNRHLTFKQRLNNLKLAIDIKHVIDWKTNKVKTKPIITGE